jgi:hypothetical protein
MALPEDTSERAAIRGDLNHLLHRVCAAHQQFNESTDVAAEAAYATRWEILNQLEELLRDAVFELAPGMISRRKRCSRPARLAARQSCTPIKEHENK